MVKITEKQLRQIIRTTINETRYRRARSGHDMDRASRLVAAFWKIDRSTDAADPEALTRMKNILVRLEREEPGPGSLGWRMERETVVDREGQVEIDPELV